MMTQEPAKHEPAVLDRLREEKREIEENIRSQREEVADLEDAIRSSGYDISKLDKLEQRYEWAFYICCLMLLVIKIFDCINHAGSNSIAATDKAGIIVCIVPMVFWLAMIFLGIKTCYLKDLQMWLLEKSECELCISDMDEDLASLEKEIQEVESLMVMALSRHASETPKE